MTGASLPGATTAVASRLLGELTVVPESLVTLPQGLLGFPACRRFALVPSEREGLFWLQSADEPTLTLLLADPFAFFPAYAVDVPDADAAAIRAATPQDVLLLAIVTMGGVGAPATANLQGPLLVNLRERLGRQIALTDPHAAVRAPIDLATARAA